MIVLDARDNADRPKPKNHVEFKGDFLWLNPTAPMIERKLNMETVEAHMKLADADNVPALFNFVEESWDVPNSEFIRRHKWWDRAWDQIKAVNPSQVVGCYAEVPAVNYWDAVIKYRYDKTKSQDDLNQWNQAKPRHTAWKLLNNRLQSLAVCVDIICPSVYLHYEQFPNEEWVGYAKANIDEAKQYGKPVYPVVWPRYHTSHIAIDLDRWRKYVASVKAMKTDGLILWDYSGFGKWSEVEAHFNVA